MYINYFIIAAHVFSDAIALYMHLCPLTQLGIIKARAET